MLVQYSNGGALKNLKTFESRKVRTLVSLDLGD